MLGPPGTITLRGLQPIRPQHGWSHHTSDTPTNATADALGRVSKLPIPDEADTLAAGCGIFPRTLRRDLDAEADEALEKARSMPPGPTKTEALRRAGLLRCAADERGIRFAKKGRLRKNC